jgi:hypothetical protein
MKQVLAVVVMACGLAFCATTESSAQYLTGSAREDFIRGAVNGCMSEKVKDQEASVIPNSLFEKHYCRCYANTLADNIRIIDLEPENKNGDRSNHEGRRHVLLSGNESRGA